MVVCFVTEVLLYPPLFSVHVSFIGAKRNMSSIPDVVECKTLPSISPVSNPFRFMNQ